MIPDSKIIVEAFEETVGLSLDKLFEKYPGYMIAGGSVSNIIYDVYHSNGLPIKTNDLDLFNINKPDVIAEDGLSGDSETKDTFNGVRIDLIDSWRVRSNPEFTSMQIIEDFDLNCCMAGILPDKTIIVTKEFEKFLETKEIKVLFCTNLIKTIFRILKKEYELHGSMISAKSMDALRALTNPDSEIYIPGIMSRKYKESFKEKESILEYIKSSFDYGESSDNCFIKSKEQYRSVKDIVGKIKDYFRYHNELSTM